MSEDIRDKNKELSDDIEKAIAEYLNTLGFATIKDTEGANNGSK